jgi:hypothetical protein
MPPQASSGLASSLAGVLEAARVDAMPLRVRFPEPLPRHAEKLMATLGVVVEIVPTAPKLSEVKTNGRSRKTRRQLSDETRRRMRAAYFARPDKRTYAPR